MSADRLKVVHFLNQFFGGEGKEDKADMDLRVKDGPVGPGRALQNILAEKGEVVATITCGDNYFAENLEEASKKGADLAASYAPDLFLAGPAFDAGRYGVACGAMCKGVHEKLGIPAVTGMYKENPGVDLYREHIYICKTGRSALNMVESLGSMVNLALNSMDAKGESKLVLGGAVGRPSENGYFPRRVTRNEFTHRSAAARSVDMLLAKILSEPFETEVKLQKFDPIKPPSPIAKMLSDSVIGLISDGGLVPKGNPDRFNSRNNTIWASYDIDELFPEECPTDDYEISHTGYYPVLVLENPSRLVPVDVLRDLEREKIVGKLHSRLYSTCGNGGDEASCRRMGKEILAELKREDIDGAILTST